MILFCKLTITSILKHFSKQKTYETNDGIFAFSHIFLPGLQHSLLQNAKCLKIIKVGTDAKVMRLGILHVASTFFAVHESTLQIRKI